MRAPVNISENARCPEHPKYKGDHPTGRPCGHCRLLWAVLELERRTGMAVWAEQQRRDYGGY